MKCNGSGEAAGEADPKRGAEELLHPLVERAEDAVELVVGDRLVGELTEEEDRVLLADRERGAVQLEVAAQEVLVELAVVLLGRRHHVGLVVQRALAEREPDRERVLLLARHAHVPAALTRLATVDRGDGGVLGPLALHPGVELRLEAVELLGVRRRCRHRVQSTRARAVRSAYRRRSRAAVVDQVNVSARAAASAPMAAASAGSASSSSGPAANPPRSRLSVRKT